MIPLLDKNEQGGLQWIPMIEWVAVGSLIIFLTVLVMLNWGSRDWKIRHLIATTYSVADEEFLRSMSNLLGPPLVNGNKVTTLVNGDRIFPAMLDAIRSAQKTITFETYIYSSGTIGTQFSHALSERARAGVRVHLLVDWVGGQHLDAGELAMMRHAGVVVEIYCPLHWYTLSHLNSRTHRKILVVDGKVGFTGGVGIEDWWIGNAETPAHWRDTHFRLEGPAVAHLQAAFMDNWLKTHFEVLHGDGYFPHLEPAGSMWAHVFRSSPRDGSESVHLMFLLSIASARKHIRIANSYFIPDGLSIRALSKARKRGVEIEIIVPGHHIDSETVRKASRARWGRLLRKGVKIYEYQPTMFHCKVMIVDDCWVTVGSTNFDNRSFRLNDEANLNVVDRAFAAEQIAIFEDDKKKSEEITYESWLRRPIKEKVLGRLASLIQSQL